MTNRCSLTHIHTPRYRPVGSSARRDTGHSSRAYGAQIPTQQLGLRAITLRAVNDFPPGLHNRVSAYTQYNFATILQPDRKIIDSGAYGYE